ncbi:hypothetical protein DOE76_03195 [Leifsonia sp. ku-ls]|jgi:hypothetical protein|nr:hypothetical protein DOE76_03195 [Leifsonia sp. ku-ls]
MAGTRSAGSLSATGWDERGLLPGSSVTLSRRDDFLACRHHVEACHRHHVVCRHHAASSLGAVRTDSALFVSPDTRPRLFPEGRP